MIKVKFHSMVDVITNSSTVIYTYQNSVTEAKELVQEVLNLMDEGLTPDDVFYYGVFCENSRYADYVEEEMDEDEDEHVDLSFPLYTQDCDWKELRKKQNKWVDDLKLSILKNEIEKPKWMESAEDGGDYWNPDTYLYMYPKDKKFEGLAEKISRLLNSVTADGGRDE